MGVEVLQLSFLCVFQALSLNRRGLHSLHVPENSVLGESFFELRNAKYRRGAKLHSGKLHNVPVIYK